MYCKEGMFGEFISVSVSVLQHVLEPGLLDETRARYIPRGCNHGYAKHAQEEAKNKQGWIGERFPKQESTNER